MIYLGKTAEVSNTSVCRIVVVSRNTHDLLALCLDSVVVQKADVPLEVVVADAGSTDGSVRLVRKRHPGVRIIELDANPGYSSAINRAVEDTFSKYVLIMNSDVQLLDGSLHELVCFMEREPEAAVAGPQLLNPDGSIQRSFNRRFPGVGSALSYALGITSIRERLYRVKPVRKILGALLWKSRRPRRVAWVGGACFIVRTEVFENIGRMDEKYFLYCEDTDLCRRMVMQGHSVWFVPSAKAVHHWNSSIGKLTDAGFLSSLRSTIIYHRTHHPGISKAVNSLMGVSVVLRFFASGVACLLTGGGEVSRRRMWLCWEALEMISGTPVQALIKGVVKRAGYLPRKILLMAVSPLGRRVDGSDGLPDVRKILVIRHDGLGDMVLTLPFIRMLKETYPGALVYVLASSSNSRLPGADHNVYQVIMAPRGGIRATVRLVRNLMSEDFDLVVDPFVTHSLGSALLAWAVGRRYRCGFAGASRERLFNVTPPPGDLTVNILNSMRTLARHLGYTGRSETSRLEGCIPVSGKDRELARNRFAELGISAEEPVLGIHPGGRYESQRWPLERFFRVAQEVYKRAKVKVVLFMASEWKNGMELSGSLPEGIVIMEDLELEHFVAAVGQMTLLLCNNSGPLHVARALGVPTVSVTGPTRQAFLPEVDRLHRMLESPLDCRPCDKPVCHHHKCLLSVGIEDVTALTLKRLRELTITAGQTAISGAGADSRKDA